MQSWAIQQKNGRLYMGTACTKRLAVAQHVFAYDKELCDRGMPFHQSQPLDERQKAVWQMCKRRGDKAVKVTISTINE